MINDGLSRLLIRGGRIVDPDRGLDRLGDLLIDEGRILSLEGTAAWKEKRTLDATGLVVCPGFLDIHCHLREPGFEDKETIATGTKAAAAGGYSSVCCMPNTDPPLDSQAVVEQVKKRAGEEGFVHVFPIGCITRGRRGEELTEMAVLAEAGVVAFSDDGDTVQDPQLMRRAMDYSRALGLPISDHCEDRRLSVGGVVNEGQVSARLGVKGIPSAAEELVVARDIVLARATGARVHIGHVSTRGSVELIRWAKEKGIAVTAEVTPHHLTLTEDRVMTGRHGPNAKMYPPLRTEEDRNCLIEGLQDGVIDAIATDHAPHTLLDKYGGLEGAAFGISGFETALGCLMSLVHKGEISLPLLVSKLSYEPARIIGKGNELGILRMGSPANITIFDPDWEWVVDSSKFASKGKNSPFDGCQFRGKVVATIVDGRIAYSDERLSSLMRETCE